jgi:2-polyprenyl-6-methoxyphenol hydroxylase-like FAD-dependent oxidoreductase
MALPGKVMTTGRVGFERHEQIGRWSMEYDLVVIGGGLAGAVLAKSLAEAGFHVLILEREKVFKDRVRGEAMFGWGVAEAARLGIDTLLRETCGHDVRFLATRIAGLPEPPVRDLVETTPHRVGLLNFHHPEMQTILLRAAVRRGVAVVGLGPGRPATVRARDDGGDSIYRARLVAAADGRDSGCRRWCGLPVRADPKRVVMAGVLFEGSQAPEDQVQLCINPPLGVFALMRVIAEFVQNRTLRIAVHKRTFLKAFDAIRQCAAWSLS